VVAGVFNADYGHLFGSRSRRIAYFTVRTKSGRINQKPDISQQFSLWNQMGSKVIRQLLVFPLPIRLLYVEAIYRAENGQLPELETRARIV
jgi:uncharacterized membrane protein (UPF0182 family)